MTFPHAIEILRYRLYLSNQSHESLCALEALRVVLAGSELGGTGRVAAVLEELRRLVLSEVFEQERRVLPAKEGDDYKHVAGR